MASFWSSIAKTTFIYIIGTVAAKLISFLMLPLYTSYISTEAYGQYDAIMAYSSIIVPLVGVSCWQGMLRFLNDKGYESQENKIISNGIFMLTCSLLLLITSYLTFCVFVDFQNKILVFLCFFAMMIHSFYLYVSRGLRQDITYIISGLVSAFVVAVVSLICVYIFHLQIETLYISQILSYIAQIFYIEYKLRIIKRISIKNIDKIILTELYQFCAPESVGTIFNWLLNSVNRIIIVAVLGYTANGIYAISNKFLAILSVFMTAFVLSFQEAIYSVDYNKIQENANDVIQKFLNIAGWIISILLLGTSIIYPLFVSGEYVEGYNLIPLFYIYFLFSSLTWILSSVVSATKRTKIVLYEKIIIGSINCILMYILVKQIGIYSSPVSLIVSEIVGIAAFKYMLERIAKVNLNISATKTIGNMLLILLVSIIFMVNNILLTLISMFISVVLFIISNKVFINIIINKFIQWRISRKFL